jgi:hypothetical protein
MKKATTVVMAIGLVLAMIIPAMAESTMDFDGYYRMRGYYFSDINLADDGETADESQAFYDHRLRVNATFNANENVKVVTRMHAFNNTVMGTNGTDNTKGDSDVNLTMRYCYGVFTTGIGQFKFGQMPSGEWGYGIFNHEWTATKLQYGAKLDSGIFFSVYTEKQAEGDGIESRDYWTTNGVAWDANNGAVDQDGDSYAALVGYKSDTINTAIIFGFGNNKIGSDGASALYGGNVDQVVYGISPYFLYTTDTIEVNAEFSYSWGKNDFDNKAVDDVNNHSWGLGLEAAYTFGMFKVQAGYGYATGQDVDEEDGTAFGGQDGGIGGDYDPLLYLMSDGKQRINDFSGLMNLNAQQIYGLRLTNYMRTGAFTYPRDSKAANIVPNANSEVAAAGAEIYFVRFDVKPMDNLGLWMVVGGAETTADRTFFNYFTNRDDPNSSFNAGSDYGWEIDLGAKWQIMDNVSYTAQFAWVDLGDAWEEINYNVNRANLAVPITNPTAATAQAWKDVDSSVYLLKNTIQIDF